MQLSSIPFRLLSLVCCSPLDRETWYSTHVPVREHEDQKGEGGLNLGFPSGKRERRLVDW